MMAMVCNPHDLPASSKLACYDLERIHEVCGLFFWSDIYESFSVSRGPEHPSEDQCPHPSDVKFCCSVTQRTVQAFACPVTPLPEDRHHHTLNPGTVVAAKGGGRKHLVAWIDMHIILLGAVIEVFNPTRDRVVSFGDGDAVRDDIARMRYPLTSN